MKICYCHSHPLFDYRSDNHHVSPGRYGPPSHTSSNKPTPAIMPLPECVTGMGRCIFIQTTTNLKTGIWYKVWGWKHCATTGKTEREDGFGTNLSLIHRFCISHNQHCGYAPIQDKVKSLVSKKERVEQKITFLKVHEMFHIGKMRSWLNEKTEVTLVWTIVHGTIIHHACF